MAKKLEVADQPQIESPRILVSGCPSIFRPERSNPLQSEVRFDRKLAVELYTPSQAVPYKVVKWFESDPSLGVTWSDQIAKVSVSTHEFTDFHYEKIKRRRFETDISENPARAIEYFLNCFQTNRKGRAYVSWERPPYEYVLNYVAERFLAYIRGKGSLDEAFGLRTKSKGRGAASPKEMSRRQGEANLAMFLFNGHISDLQGKPKIRGEPYRTRALKLVARDLNCSVKKVENLLSDHKKKFTI